MNARPSFDRVKAAFFAFIALNIFTIPLSPVSGGVMTREAYMPIMYVKLAIVAVFVILALRIFVLQRLYDRRRGW